MRRSVLLLLLCVQRYVDVSVRMMGRTSWLYISVQRCVHFCVRRTWVNYIGNVILSDLLMSVHRLRGWQTLCHVFLSQAHTITESHQPSAHAHQLNSVIVPTYVMQDISLIISATIFPLFVMGSHCNDMQSPTKADNLSIFLLIRCAWLLLWIRNVCIKLIYCCCGCLSRTKRQK